MFHADDVARGPIATLAAPGVTMPFMLHSAWMPRAVPAQDLPRNRFADELDRLGELDADLQRVVLQVADDLDSGAPLAS